MVAAGEAMGPSRLGFALIVGTAEGHCHWWKQQRSKKESQTSAFIVSSHFAEFHVVYV